MLVTSLLVSCTVLALVSGQPLDTLEPVYPPPYPYGGSYCSRLPSSNTCCVGRRDDCSTPISTTRCYCDSFCNQHGPNRDCCPDYESFCGGPPFEREPGCPYDGVHYKPNDSVRLRDTCYACNCKQVSLGKYELQCDYVCSPKPSGVCLYNYINYPVGGPVNIGDSCYTCTCQRSWYTQVTMNCVFTCSPQPNPDPNVCFYENRYFKENDEIRENCKICTCQRTSTGTYGMSCRSDPICRYQDGCHYNSQVFREGSRIRKGLQECTCTKQYNGELEFICAGPTPNGDIINRINAANYGWTAYTYSFLLGRTMEEVFHLRTGVCRPPTQVIYDLTFTESESAKPVHAISFQKDTFDSRTQWPGLLRPISDAGDHPISWAITIADLAADRMAIHTAGKENLPLSAQNLISCVRHSESHCSSSIKGWEYLNRYGIVSEECYPRNVHGDKTCEVNMGERYTVSSCPSGRGHGAFTRLPSQKRISTNEKVIRYEILTNGPVQAHIRVKEDFFYYKSGVYRHIYGNLHNTREFYQAVRIIGWGTDLSTGSPVDYWICANSWGASWGENGYFRILRGKNECQVEEYVFAVWPQQ